MNNKLRNYFVFDENDPSQHDLIAAYPAKRRLMCILRTVLLALLVLSTVLTCVLPACTIHIQSRGQSYGKNYRFSPIDLFPGALTAAVQQMDLVKEFEENGGKELLEDQNQKHFVHQQASDAQILADVAMKRSKKFNTYARMNNLGSFLSAFETLRSKLSYEMSMGVTDETLLQLLRENFERVYSAIYEFLPDFVDFFSYDLERLNFGGVRKIMTIAILAYADNKEDTTSWYDASAQAYLLGSYRAEDIFAMAMKSQGFAYEYFPDYQDAFYLTSSSSIYTVASDNVAYLSSAPILSAFVLVINLFMLIIVLFSIISVVKSWKYPDRRIRGSGYSVLLVYPGALMLVILQLVMGASIGAVYAGTVSAVCLIAPVFAFLVFVYEIVFDVMVKKFNNRFKTRTAQFA